MEKHVKTQNSRGDRGEVLERGLQEGTHGNMLTGQATQYHWNGSEIDYTERVSRESSVLFHSLYARVALREENVVKVE